MNAIIVSDLHIGSRYFLLHEFKTFIERIPRDYELILNGDIIDDPRKTLTPLHQRILDIIVRISKRQKVVWVRGSHDNGFILDDTGNIEFKTMYVTNNDLLIAHGDGFDQIMPVSRVFIKAFSLMHELRIFFGAAPVHVSNYAKRWKRLYSVLLKNVMKNAVICAKDNGCTAVVCGHTHNPEDRLFDGIRYINSGAWTESPAYYILVNDKNMTLKSVHDDFEIRMDESLNEKAIQAA